MERIDLVPREEIPALARDAAEEEGDPTLATDILSLAGKALASPLFERIRRAKRVMREVPFSWSEEGKVYEGVIDLIFEEPDGLVIVDYKTDRVTPSDLPAKAEHYRPQIGLYGRAVEALTKKKVKERLLFFVRLGESVRV
jgi:ATP-dependent helicase/nuclease subunit A